VKADLAGTMPHLCGVLGVMLLLLFGYNEFEDMRTGREISQRVSVAHSSLYERLGGQPAIEAVTDDILDRLVKEPRFAAQFTGATPEQLKKIRNHVADLLCETTGGPCKYKGRDMRTIHKGMGIHEDDWNVTLGLLQQTLDKFKVPSREQEEVKAIIALTKSGIVE